MAHLFMDRCDLYVQEAVAPGHLGSPSKAAYKLHKKDVHCSFLKSSERLKNDEMSDFTSVEVLLCLFPRDIDVSERMVIRNLRDRRGEVLEQVPFVIEKLIDARTLGKLVNHRSAELRRDYSLKESL